MTAVEIADRLDNAIEDVVGAMRAKLGADHADELLAKLREATTEPYTALDELDDAHEKLKDEVAELRGVEDDWVVPLQRDLGRLVDGVLDHLKRGIVDGDELLAMAEHFDREYPEYAKVTIL